MKVHKVVLLVVDLDQLGAETVCEVLENARYPNHCIGPQVMGVATVDVDWSDEHPLNHRDTQAAAFAGLFGSKP